VRQRRKRAPIQVLEVYAVLILLIILVLLAFGTSPILPYSRGWGYYPSGGLGLIAVIILVILLLNGGLHF
jgi:polyferredoxin